MSVQKDIPPRTYLGDDVPFGIGRELIVNVPIDPRGYADVYINDMTGLLVDLPRSRNANRLEAAIPLAIEVAACPNDPNEPIPREKMVAEDKLTAEGGLSEMKVILEWGFNFRTLTVNLPEHKHIARAREISQMIASCRTTKQQLESTIGCLGHVGYVIPWVFHFLSRLQTLLSETDKGRFRSIRINEKCVKNLVMMQNVLNKAREGVDMNLLLVPIPRLRLLFGFVPCQVGGVQGSRVSMAIQSAGRAFIQSIK